MEVSDASERPLMLQTAPQQRVMSPDVRRAVVRTLVAACGGYSCLSSEYNAHVSQVACLPRADQAFLVLVFKEDTRGGTGVARSEGGAASHCLGLESLKIRHLTFGIS